MLESELKEIALDMKKEALENGYEISMPTKGRSMFPLLSSKNRIVIVKLNRQNLKTGDIILYRSAGNGNMLVAHRFIRNITRNGKDMLITKGDLCFLCDSPIDPANVLGKVMMIKKAHFNIRLDNAFGLAINKIAMVLSLFNIIYFSIKIGRKLKRTYEGLISSS